MHWMPTNVLPSLILRMVTSRRASNCFAADRPMVCKFRQARRCRKMFTPRHTKPLGLSDHQDLYGELLPRSHHLRDLPVQPEIGEDGLRRSTPHLNHQTHMINGSHLEVPSLPHHGCQVQGKSSK